MPTKLNKRLKLLEERVKALDGGSIWVDMMDNKVRIDIGTRHSKEIKFPTVFQAGKYVEEWMAKSERVCGICFVSNILDLLSDRPLTEIPDRLVNFTGVIMNLIKVRGSMAEAGLATWLFMHPKK